MTWMGMLSMMARIPILNSQCIYFVHPKMKLFSSKLLIQWQCTLTLSRPTGEGTGSPVSHSFQSGWIHRPAEDDSPSPIRWERAGVRVILLQNPKLFLRESSDTVSLSAGFV